MNGMTYQIITGVQKIKLSGSEKRVFARWMNEYAEESKYTYGTPPFIMFNGVISTAISLAGTIVMYFFAVQSGVSVADYTAFNAAYGMLSGALMSVAGIALTAARIKPVIEMAKPIMETQPEISEGKQIVTKVSGGIELSNVSFRYDENSPLVVDDLSLKIKPGQYVAIVGKTGCGKSTLLRLLLGFEKPQKGAIYYDGKDINTLDLKSLRKRIGVVTQNGKLFQGDIYSNIVISAPYLSVDDAWKAAEIADIADDIRAMPMGMHTIISEGAGGISGGQKQRLMIARAVAPNPKILMFDEATSALDNITQKKVSEALDSLKCTRIVIAHRLSTIKQCDRIIVLDGGKIVEDGTYDELLRREGYFYELVERQRDTTDRNRTSPFAFTGNKFEFRMLGSSNSIACANIMLNAAVAESLKIYADRLEGAADFETALHDMIKKTIKDHKRIIFNGNGYDDSWIKEATEKRGLCNYRTTADAVPHLLDKKNMDMLTAHKVFTEAELKSRYEITLENYCKTVIIEANTMVDMAKKQILPAVSDYASDLAETVGKKLALGTDIACGYEKAKWYSRGLKILVWRVRFSYLTVPCFI